MTNRILIVDDQRDISRLLRSALETVEKGLSVSEAASGEEAMLEATKGKIDLLITDFRLPGMSGVDLAKKFRARNPDLRVMVITGVSDNKSLDEIKASNPDAYFAKPVPMAEFLDAVERCLNMERTILPVGKPATAPLAERTRTLADMLSDVRKAIGAQAVILLNERGQIKAEAGDIPDPSMILSLTSNLISVYTSAVKVSSVLGNTGGDVHLFCGKTYDIFYVPLGPIHSLLFAGKDMAAFDHVTKKIDAINKSRDEILEALKKLGVTGGLSPEIVAQYEARMEQAAAPSPVPAPAPEADVPMDDDFAKLFADTGDKKSDLDSFWNQAAEKVGFTQPDKLTFDQATKLGLTPSDKK
jgi:DNA-binding NarL/FixJ family response regulator